MWQCAATRRPPLHCGQRSPALPQVVAGDVRRPLLPQGAFTGGRSPRPGQPRVGARACVLNVVAGNAGRDISDGEVRRAGSSHLSVSSIYIMTIQSVRALAPPARCAGPGVARRSGLPPWEPPRLPRTKPGNTTKLGSSYETEQGRNGKITDVLSHDGYFDERHDCLRPPDCVLSRATALRRPGLPHTRGTLVRHASLRRRTRHLSSPSSACGLAWEEPMGASSPHLVAALSLAVNTRSSSSKLSFLAFSMAPLAL